MLVSEIFYSIQGESTHAGLPSVFVRLAGCNLRCAWCDTPYAQTPEGAKDLDVSAIVKEVKAFKCRLVEITGGEPLMQKDTKELVKRLVKEGFKVLIETNGSICLDGLDGLDAKAVKIVDVKCPSSGQAGTFLVENVKCLAPNDEVKFVIATRDDYEFAKKFLEEIVKDRTENILFAPVRPDLAPKDLAGWILKDRLNVRLQLQLHAYIWDGERGR